MKIWNFTPGYKMKIIAVNWLAMVICCASPVVHADSVSENDQPSMELLEFLGDWETKDGSWVDPMQLDEMLDPNLAQKDSQGIKDLKDKKETEERKDD